MNIPNSVIEPISLREYGRNLQNLVHRVEQECDKKKRTAYAKALVPIMISLNRQLQRNTAAVEKVWQHIFLIADHKLDIDVPYLPKAEPTTLNTPASLPYFSKVPLQERYYGRNLRLALLALKETENKAHIQSAIPRIAKWILSYYRKNSSVDRLFKYFQDFFGKENLPEFALFKRKLHGVAPANSRSREYRKKRFFRRKRKG